MKGPYSKVKLEINSRQYLFALIGIHILLYLVISFNIPIFRPLVVFAYLSFVPGFAFLGILKMRSLNIIDNFLFSVGLSITLLMFLGVFSSLSYPFLNISRPLSIAPLVVTITAMTLSFFILEFRRDIPRVFKNFSIEKLNLIRLIGFLHSTLMFILQTIRFRRSNFNAFIGVLLLVFLPILSGLAAIYAKDSLPLLIVIIAFLFVLSILSKRLIPVKFYPLLIFSISLALALQFTLMSQHIMGADAPLEYRVYSLTVNNGIWQPLNFGYYVEIYYTSMLSITVLPTTYSVIMGINGELLFKLFYPFVFCLVPLISYRICISQGWKSTNALLAAFFLISSPAVFYGTELLSLNRQIIGSFFLLLSVFVLVKSGDKPRNKQLLLFIFGAALTVSHYALMYIYIGFLIAIFVGSRILRRPSNILTGPLVIISSVFAISWYGIVSSPMIANLSAQLQSIATHFLADLSNPAARSADIFSPHQVQTIASPINWALFGIAHLLVILGIVVVTLKPKNTGFSFEYRIIVMACSIILLMAVAIPNLAPVLNFSRFYAITFLFLAPCFVLGGNAFLSEMKKVLKRLNLHFKHWFPKMNLALLLMAILVGAYFLSQSGFVNKVTGGSILSTTLNWNKLEETNLTKAFDPLGTINFYTLYTPNSDVYGSQWLSASMKNNPLIYSDGVSKDHQLQVFGLISQDKISILTNNTIPKDGSYIYLRFFNIESGWMFPLNSLPPYNISDISTELVGNDQIYTNGGCEVLYAQK